MKIDKLEVKFEYTDKPININECIYNLLKRKIMTE